MSPKPRLSPADIVILVAGALLLIGSFLAFYTVPGYTVGTVRVGSQSVSAWSRGLFGIATVAVVCGVAMAAQIALSTWATGVNLPQKPFGMRWDQVHLALGFQTAIDDARVPRAEPRGSRPRHRLLGDARVGARAVRRRDHARRTAVPTSARRSRVLRAYSPATTSAMSSPAAVGLVATRTPASSSTAIFACAVPFEPEMIAPAWPIFLPGGAVTPAM